MPHSLISFAARRIPYIPELREACGGSITSSLLMTQLEYWFSKNDFKPFYKFSAPCGHELYRNGDSLCEELNVSKKELHAAFQRIGTKYSSFKAFSKATEDGNPFEGMMYAAVFNPLSGITTYYRNHSFVESLCRDLLHDSKGQNDLSEQEFSRFRSSKNVDFENEEMEFREEKKVSSLITIDYLQKNTNKKKEVESLRDSISIFAKSSTSEKEQDLVEEGEVVDVIVIPTVPSPNPYLRQPKPKKTTTTYSPPTPSEKSTEQRLFANGQELLNYFNRVSERRLKYDSQVKKACDSILKHATDAEIQCVIHFSLDETKYRSEERQYHTPITIFRKTKLKDNFSRRLERAIASGYGLIDENDNVWFTHEHPEDRVAGTMNRNVFSTEDELYHPILVRMIEDKTGRFRNALNLLRRSPMNNRDFEAMHNHFGPESMSYLYKKLEYEKFVIDIKSFRDYVKRNAKPPVAQS